MRSETVQNMSLIGRQAPTSWARGSLQGMLCADDGVHADPGLLDGAFHIAGAAAALAEADDQMFLPMTIGVAWIGPQPVLGTATAVATSVIDGSAMRCDIDMSGAVFRGLNLQAKRGKKLAGSADHVSPHAEF